MASVPEKPIADWLRASRTSQLTADGDPWTYDRLFREMREAIGWAPAHPNYSRYENGKSTPNRETLAKFVRFWATKGVEGPDLTPPPAEEEATPSSADYLARIDSLVSLVTQLLSRQDDIQEVLAGATRMAQANADRIRQLEDRLAARGGETHGAGGGLAAPHQIEG